VKFDDMVEGVPFDYGNVYQRVSYGEEDSLKIGVSTEQVSLLQDLSSALNEPFEIMYIATELSRTVEPARYESMVTLDRAELALFFERYGEAFEKDGRHGLWVIAPNGLLVFSQHDIIYAYGPLDSYDELLRGRDFTMREFSIPGPHFHFYDGNYDALVAQMMAERGWNRYELEPIDEET
jgi:hypothetical protein